MTAQLQWLDDESHTQELVLDELEPRARQLFSQIRAFDCGCLLLRFLEAHAHRLMTIDDIAYHLVEPDAVVEQSLYAMIDLGLARRVGLAGLSLFGFTMDQEKQQLVRGLCAWQDGWQARLARLERMVGGKRAQLQDEKESRM